MSGPTPKCPIRAGEPCTLCQMGVTGPQDCGLVYLVMDDPETRELYVASRRSSRAVQAESDDEADDHAATDSRPVAPTRAA